MGDLVVLACPACAHRWLARVAFRNCSPATGAERRCECQAPDAERCDARARYTLRLATSEIHAVTFWKAGQEPVVFPALPLVGAGARPDATNEPE